MKSQTWVSLTGAFVSLVLCQLAFGQYVNDEWDTDFQFECNPGEHIYYVNSKFDSSTRSRKWRFDCRVGFVSEDCEWTDWLNQYCDNFKRVKGTGDSGVKYEGKSDRPQDKGGDNTHHSVAFAHYCPSNGIVTGFIGKHQVTGKDLQACDGNTRDYLWKIKCCKPNTKRSKDGKWSAIGNRRGTIDWNVPGADQVIHAVAGKYYWDGDRDFSFRFNTRAKCFAQNMTITSTPPVTPTAMKVIGLASNLNCNPANKVSLEQGDLKEVTKSTEVTTETTHDYTLSRSISVTAEQEVAGFTSGYGFSASVGAGWGSGKSSTIGESKTYATSASMAMEYYGPKVVMLMGVQEEYKVEGDSADATYGIMCEDGTSWMQNGKVKISTESYGRTHFSSMSFSFLGGAPQKNQTDESIALATEYCEKVKPDLESCLTAMSASFALSNDDNKNWRNSFVQCLKDNSLEGEKRLYKLPGVGALQN